MKTILVSISLIMFVFGYSQNNATSDFKKNEIKINALTLVTGGVNFSYEHLLNEESGLGVALFASANEDIYTTTFSVTPYYRFYFGSKPAAGFYAEGFGMYNNFKYTNLNVFGGNSSSQYPGTQSDFALGIGLGAKWVTKKGFLFEINRASEEIYSIPKAMIMDIKWYYVAV